VLINRKIREAIQVALERTGTKEFSSITGLPAGKLDAILGSNDQYLPVKIVSVACQINKNQGDPDPNHSSVTDCMKDATMRLPPRVRADTQNDHSRPVPVNPLKTRASIGPFCDQKSVRLVNFGVNTITLLIVSYFIGGIALAPLVNLQPCVGVDFSPARVSPCLGSILGLILGAFGSLVYTYYYFTHRV